MNGIYNDIYLSRLLDNGKQTLGLMQFFDGFTNWHANTLELPWKNNRPDESCIPADTYPWIKYMSPNHGYEVILLQNVPGRKGIEIHIANYVHQLLGCIAVGVGLKDIDKDGLIDVTESKKAFDSLMTLLPDKGFIHIDDKKLKRI